MSVVGEKAEEIVRRSSVAHQLFHSASRRVLAIHPSDTISFSIRLYGPPSHTIDINVRGIPPSITRVAGSQKRF